MFTSMIAEAERTGDYAKVTARVLVELRGAFPASTIPEPVRK